MIDGKPLPCDHQGNDNTICFPLRLNGNIKGILYIDWLQERSFTNDEISFLTMIADEISYIIELNINYRNIEEENVRLEKLFEMENNIIGISPIITYLTDCVDWMIPLDKIASEIHNFARAIVGCQTC